MKRRFGLGERTSKFIYCVDLLLALWTPMVFAQEASPSPTPTFTSTFTAAETSTVTYISTATPTSTNNPFATPTWTYTWDPWSTDTATPSSPTATFTPTNTPTFTQTGTISPTLTFTPTMTHTPNISRASLALMPTAYTNAWDRWDGLNWDISFSYYIGSIAEKDNTETNADFLNPLRLWLLTSDLKYAWLDENGETPGMASGLLMTLLLNGGNPGATGSASQNFQLTGNSMGGVYTVLSHSISKNTAVHFGFVEGFRDAFNTIGIGDYAPNLNYSDLLPLLTGKLANLRGESPSSMFYTGWNTRFLGTNWKFEIWKPFPMDENPVLFNTQIDGLFAFNLAYERWSEGYALLGYFNFRFTIIPVTPPY